MSTLPQVIWKGCHTDNYATGRAWNGAPDVAVVHRAGGTMAGMASWFATGIDARRAASPGAGRSSAHFGLPKLLSPVEQYVRVTDTAYSNGIIDYMPLIVQQRYPLNPNGYTLSFEFEGVIGDEITEYQISCFTALIKAYRIPADSIHILRHNDITHTACPGLTDAFMSDIISRVTLPEQKDTMTDDERKLLYALAEAISFNAKDANDEGFSGNYTVEAVARTLAYAYNTNYKSLSGRMYTIEQSLPNL